MDEAPPALSTWGRPAAVAVGALWCASVALIVHRAWVADDAFLTLRTVDNLLAGHGLRWNVAERVQVYTHPLWMAVLCLSYGLVRNPILAAIGAGVVTSAAALWVLVRRVASTPIAAALALTALLGSRAFADFATAGLENPLTHLLVLFGIAGALPGAAPRPTAIRLAALTSLAMLTRLDLVLLFAPALLWWVMRAGGLRAAGAPLGVAALPFVAWEAASLLYYGFLVPNTAYAKLGTGLPLGPRLVQGLRYLGNSLEHDPVTLLVTGGGLGLCLLTGPREARPWAVGAVLYLAYVLWIGGDFMSGRFLTAPLVVAVAWGVRHRALAAGPAGPAALGGIALLALLGGPPTVLLRAHTYRSGVVEVGQDGIADERAVMPDTTLAAVRAGTALRNKQADRGRALRAAGERVALGGALGIQGFLSGPGVHFVDAYALADPLLARMPVRNPRSWRIGHVVRVVPRGYLASLRQGRNRIVDPGTHAYYDELCRITRDPLLGGTRLAALVRMHTGVTPRLLDPEDILRAGDDRDPLP